MIRSLGDRIISDMITIGELLQEGKEGLPHGEFEGWVKADVGMSPRRASEFMRLAGRADRAIDREAYISGLRGIAGDSKSKIIPALALPEHEITSAGQQGTVMGTPIEEVREYSVRQLKLAIREFTAPPLPKPETIAEPTQPYAAAENPASSPAPNTLTAELEYAFLGAIDALTLLEQAAAAFEEGSTFEDWEEIEKFVGRMFISIGQKTSNARQSLLSSEVFIPKIQRGDE